jgi:hypothetical protein
MQAYEHIMSDMILLAKKGYTLEDNLRYIERLGAYFTLPDSIRPLVKPDSNTQKALRPPSHFTDGAYMIFISGEVLKKCESYPEDKMFIPVGMSRQGADGFTDIELAKEKNGQFFETADGKAVLIHLMQDVLSDNLFQKDLANCHLEGQKDFSQSHEKKEINLYGLSIQSRSVLLVKTGKTVDMDTFRKKLVAPVQKLSTLELYRRLKGFYPDITFAQIESAVLKSYNNFYPEKMQNAKKYAIPSEEEREQILKAINNDTEYYIGIKSDLIKTGAFNSVDDINKTIKEYIDNATSINQEKITPKQVNLSDGPDEPGL